MLEYTIMTFNRNLARFLNHSFMEALWGKRGGWGGVEEALIYYTLLHFIAITSPGEERANLGAFRAFVRFVLLWICRFPLPLGVWEGLRFVIVALPGLFSYFFLLKPVIYIYIFCASYFLISPRRFLHYENKPIQYTENFTTKKNMKIFR